MWWFLFMVVPGDQSFVVIWGWGWYFQDTDCCPASQFRPFLPFGSGDSGITGRLVPSRRHGHCLCLLTACANNALVGATGGGVPVNFSAFTVVLARPGGGNSMKTRLRAPEPCRQVATGPWSHGWPGHVTGLTRRGAMLIRYSQAAYVALLLFCVLLLLRHKKPVARLDQANDDLLVASGPSLVQELESREPEAAQHWASPGPAFEATPSPVPSHKPGASPEDAPNGTVPHPRPNVAPDAVAPPPSAPEGPREAVPDTPPEAAPSVGPHGAQVAVAAALRADAAANAGASNAWLRVREIPRLLGAAEAARLRARGVVVGVHVFGHNPNFVVAVNGTLRFVSRLILAHHVKRRGDHWIGTMHAAWVADCLQWAEAAIGAPIPRVDVLVSEFGPAPYNASRLLRGVKVRRTVDPGYNRHILAHGEVCVNICFFRVHICMLPPPPPTCESTSRCCFGNVWNR